METRLYASRLRYLDAHDLDDGVVDFDGLDVIGHDGERLGAVNGFIVDLASGRVLYIVIDSGGWFRTRRFLAPIGHAVVDQAKRALSLDITRDTLHGYPEFEEGSFSEFSDADLRAFETRMAQACCPDDNAVDGALPLEIGRAEGVDESPWPYDTQRHYRQPAWWTGGAYVHERLRPVESPAHRVSPQAIDGEDAAPREGR